MVPMTAMSTRLGVVLASAVVAGRLAAGYAALAAGRRRDPARGTAPGP